MDVASPGSMAAQTTQTDLQTDPTGPDTDSAARVEPADRLWGLTVCKLHVPVTHTELQTSARPGTCSQEGRRHWEETGAGAWATRLGLETHSCRDQPLSSPCRGCQLEAA
eukprot:23677-Rhodomonas_salina.1